MSLSAKVAIIICVYNNAGLLSRCLDSIFNQTYKSLFLVAVFDTGSTDGGLIVLEKYRRRFPDNMIVLKMPHQKVSSARNLGLEFVFSHLACEYICFVDSDDCISNNYLSAMLAKIEGCDFCLCGFQILDEDGNLLNKTDGLISRTYTKEQYWDFVASSRLGVSTVLWNKLFRRDLFSGLRFKPNKAYEDQQILHHIVNRCRLVQTIPDCLYFYYRYKSSSTFCVTFDRQADCVQAFIDRCDYFIQAEDNRHYLLTANRAIREFRLLRPRSNEEQYKVIKKSLKRMIRKGGYGGSLKRWVRWHLEILFSSTLS